jgi:PAS domain S-box-containing protein
MLGKSILIADDEAPVRNLLARFIEAEGCQIFFACNGRDAVEMAKNHPIDLAILDIVMPDMDGVEALKQIKAIDETIEVLMITGNAQLESLREILFKHGAYDYLLKPFDAVEIKLAVRRALRNREFFLKGNVVRDDMPARIREMERQSRERIFNLRQSQIQYRNMVEGSANMILISQGDQVRFANAASLEMTGYSRAEIMEMSLFDFVHPEDWQSAIHGNWELSSGKKIPDSRAFRLIKKDGSSIWVEDRTTETLWAEAPASMHMIQDISDRLKNEESLRIRDAAMATSISGIALADLEGNITYANRAFLKMWGYSNLNELIGKPIRRLFDSQIRGEKAVEALRTKGGYVDEVAAVRKDGSSFYVQVSASMVLDESDRSICIMGSFLDITKQKMAEEFMLRTEKLSSLGQLSAGLAHELRNPLAVVSSCSQFCLENFRLEGLVRENFEVIYRNTQRATKLINDLMAFARPGELVHKEVDVNEVLMDVLQMNRLEVDPGRVALEQSLKKGLPKIMGDKEKLRQVFFNLMQNAIQAVSGRGTIILESRFLESNNMLEVNVIDDGPGIPEDCINKVFDPFFTTKDGGTGLGLSICHSIVEQHMGAIRVEPVEEGGTRVCVRLPAIEYREDNDAG